MASTRREPQHCVGVAGVGAWLGVAGATVSQWFVRYGADNLPAADFDAPARGAGDVERYWLDNAERKQEWAAWQADRPSRGRPGEPKPWQAERHAANRAERAATH
jgi:hypothetical protein